MQEWTASKEHVIFLIDCQPSMLEPCGVNDKDVRSLCIASLHAVACLVVLCCHLSPLSLLRCAQSGYDAENTYAEVALIVARNIMKTHIISNSRDSFAVVLYGTVCCLCAGVAKSGLLLVHLQALFLWRVRSLESLFANAAAHLTRPWHFSI